MVYNYCIVTLLFLYEVLISQLTTKNFSSCSHTQNQGSSWWKINDLGGGKPWIVQKVIVYNRMDPCCESRIDGAKVLHKLLIVSFARCCIRNFCLLTHSRQCRHSSMMVQHQSHSIQTFC